MIHLVHVNQKRTKFLQKGPGPERELGQGQEQGPERRAQQWRAPRGREREQRISFWPISDNTAKETGFTQGVFFRGDGQRATVE